MRRVLLGVLLSAVTAPPKLVVPAGFQRLFETGRWDATPKSFRIIALSQLADGCVAQAHGRPELLADARTCVLNAVKHAERLPRSTDGLFLTHLNLIYGAADQLGGCESEQKHLSLARQLARRSLADPLKHLPSNEQLAARWPADHSATLASLVRADHAHGTSLHVEPLAAWKKVMEAHLDASTGLPWSDVAAATPGAKLPRGCAQSMITTYLTEVDAPLAEQWWSAYREHFFVALGPVRGFREWPKGRDRAADVDSGPIVFGIGTAASALAITAAKRQNDLVTAAHLEASEALALQLGAGGTAAQQLIAQAIAFNGKWAHPP